MEFKTTKTEPRQRQIVRVIQRAIYKGNTFHTQDGKYVIPTDYIEGWTEDVDNPLIRKEREKAVDERREDARKFRDD